MTITYGERKILEATCDACGASLVDVEVWRENGDPSKPENVSTYLNRSVLRNLFGYPDKDYDPLGDTAPELDLCRSCTGKALAAIGVSTNRFCGA